jgi:hypothetical protein
VPGRRIVILTHERQGLHPNFAISHLAFESWQAAGHRIHVQQGLKGAPEADLAILHVDLTVVPEPYLELARRYPRCLNLATADISKRRVSLDLLGQHDSYDGPVMVKTDLNHYGLPEQRLALVTGGLMARLKEGARRRLPAAWVGRLPGQGYPIFEHRSQVPRWVWRRPELVVEPFFTERLEALYALNQWHFLGSRGLILTAYSPSPIVKIDNRVAVRPFHNEVPEEIRRRRDELGFDYGKFDYVVTDSGAKLLDANRTQWMPYTVEEPRMAAMASGLSDFLP